MTDKQYLMKMFVFTRRLSDACDNEGYDSDTYKAVLQDIAVFASRFNRSRRRRDWLGYLIVWTLIGFLVVVLLDTAC